MLTTSISLPHRQAAPSVQPGSSRRSNADIDWAPCGNCGCDVRQSQNPSASRLPFRAELSLSALTSSSHFTAMLLPMWRNADRSGIGNARNDREYKETDGGCAPRLMSKHGWSPDPGGPMAPTTFGLVGRAPYEIHNFQIANSIPLARNILKAPPSKRRSTT
jgi:hypothetical protein